MSRWLRLLSFVIVVFAAALPVRLVAQAPADSGSEAEVVTAPVELDGVELFRVRGVSSLPAAERAQLIHDRLIDVAADRTIPLESLRVVEGDGVSRIQAGDRLIAAVVNTDASMEQVGRTELANAQKKLRERFPKEADALLSKCAAAAPAP